MAYWTDFPSLIIIIKRAIKDDSRFFLVLEFGDAEDKIDHLNACVGYLIKCFAGSELPFHFSCSFTLIETFLFVSPIYTSPQEQFLLKKF